MSTDSTAASSTTVVFLDMRHETDLSALPVGTLIITVGPTENVTHEDRQYMKCQRNWISPDGGHWDDESLAEDLREQINMDRRAIATYIPIYPAHR
jgi:hypothetical protein